MIHVRGNKEDSSYTMKIAITSDADQSIGATGLDIFHQQSGGGGNARRIGQATIIVPPGMFYHAVYNGGADGSTIKVFELRP
jgi:hypothetical protein